MNLANSWWFLMFFGCSLVVLCASWWNLVVISGFGWFFVVLCGSWGFLVVLGGSLCFFYGSWQFSVILGGSWRFLVVPNDLLVSFFYGSQGFFVLFFIVLGDS